MCVGMDKEILASSAALRQELEPTENVPTTNTQPTAFTSFQFLTDWDWSGNESHTHQPPLRNLCELE